MVPMGETVVVHEPIRRAPGVEADEQVLLYQVEDGAIDPAWIVEKE